MQKKNQVYNSWQVSLAGYPRCVWGGRGLQFWVRGECRFDVPGFFGCTRRNKTSLLHKTCMIFWRWVGMTKLVVWQGWGLAVLVGVDASGKKLSFLPTELLEGRRVVGSTLGGFKGKSELPGLVDMCVRNVCILHTYSSFLSPIFDMVLLTVDDFKCRILDWKSLLRMRCLFQRSMKQSSWCWEANVWDAFFIFRKK